MFQHFNHNSVTSKDLNYNSNNTESATINNDTLLYRVETTSRNLNTTATIKEYSLRLGLMYQLANNKFTTLKVGGIIEPGITRTKLYVSQHDDTFFHYYIKDEVSQQQTQVTSTLTSHHQRFNYITKEVNQNNFSIRLQIPIEAQIKITEKTSIISGITTGYQTVFGKNSSSDLLLGYKLGAHYSI